MASPISTLKNGHADPPRAHETVVLEVHEVVWHFVPAGRLVPKPEVGVGLVVSKLRPEMVT